MFLQTLLPGNSVAKLFREKENKRGTNTDAVDSVFDSQNILEVFVQYLHLQHCTDERVHCLDSLPASDASANGHYWRQDSPDLKPLLMEGRWPLDDCDKKLKLTYGEMIMQIQIKTLK